MKIKKLTKLKATNTQIVDSWSNSVYRVFNYSTGSLQATCTTILDIGAVQSL